MSVIHFTKMHGLGNDFVVIDNRQQQYNLSKKNFKYIADRHFGIGCDQILLIENSSQEEVDFKYRIFNADGSEVQQCGNGARCFARYINEKGISTKKELIVETLSGIIYLYLEDHENNNNYVRVNMGVPDFLPQALPFIIANKNQIKNNYYQLTLLNNHKINFSAVSIGNPHITILNDNIKELDIKSISEQVLKQDTFPQGVNIGFMQKIDKNNVLLRVYERGTGETLACGTGACAAIVNGVQQGILNHQVRVQLHAGDLIIKWDGNKARPVWMSGPASFVFEGKIEI
jgi:diaminopimelate epimerase